jgi:hypothetical protein
VSGLDANAQIFGDFDHVPGPQAAPGSDERVPELPVVMVGAYEEDLGGPAAGSPAQKARRKDTAAVDHQQVARVQEVGQVAEPVMAEAAGGAIEDEEPRRIALRQGLLRDELGRQVVVEEADVHRRQIRAC